MRLIRRANFTDRLLLGFLVILSLLILVRRERIAGWPSFILLNGALVTMILALVATSKRWPAAHAWYPLPVPILLFEEIALLNFLFVDGWRDRYLLAFEGWLFAEPPTVWLVGVGSTLLTELLAIGYLSYYFILLTVAIALDRRGDTGPFFGVMGASVLSYLLCYAAFIAFPTEGPAHTLRHLHTEVPPGGPFHGIVAFIQAGAGVHGNAFPSAHAAGAAAALVFAWRHVPKLAAVLTPCVILMCAGAVYFRYHYFSDMVAGVLVGSAAAGFVMAVVVSEGGD